MRCEACQGTGMLLKITKTLFFADRPVHYHWEHVPCPDCIGGIASCCDTAGASQAHILDAAEQVDSGDKV
jgi:hypothetical protein